MRPRRTSPTARLALLPAVALVAACGEADSTSLEGPFDLLVEGVHLVDVDAGTVVEGRSVVIREGRIAAIWPTDEVPGDIEVERRISGEGRWVIPGLWDAHVHFRGGEALVEENRALLPLYPAVGVTTVRDAGGDLTGELMAWRDSIARGELIGPRILISGPKLDGPRPSWEGSLALAEAAEVPAAFDSLQALGVDYVKLYDGSISPEVFMAAVREAEARGLTITGHMPLGVDFLEAVEAGLDGTEHLYYVFKGTRANRDEVTRRVRAGELGFWGAFWTMLDAEDPEREAAVFAAMAERGAVVLPTLHIGEVLSRVEEVDHASDPELAYIPDGIRETYAGRVASARRSSPEVRANNRRLRELMAGIVAPMHEAGVTILAGSDAGPFNSYTYPGFALHEELAALVAAGLTPAEALRSATAAPADFMGVGEAMGRVAPGYVADLVLLDRNPLEEISATRSVSTVILRGEEVLDREALEGLLATSR